jgi:cell division protein FtsB
MKVNNDLLLTLMQEVELRVDGLLQDISKKQEEIDKLKNENNQLKDNYTKILKEIAVYVAELEAIKYSNT